MLNADCKSSQPEEDTGLSFLEQLVFADYQDLLDKEASCCYQTRTNDVCTE
jgi:hypothetical protein